MPTGTGTDLFLAVVLINPPNQVIRAFLTLRHKKILCVVVVTSYFSFELSPNETWKVFAELVFNIVHDKSMLFTMLLGNYVSHLFCFLNVMFNIFEMRVQTPIVILILAPPFRHSLQVSRNS